MTDPFTDNDEIKTISSVETLLIAAESIEYHRSNIRKVISKLLYLLKIIKAPIKEVFGFETFEFKLLRVSAGWIYRIDLLINEPKTSLTFEASKQLPHIQDEYVILVYRYLGQLIDNLYESIPEFQVVFDAYINASRSD